jgi:hypothetical protein
MEYPYDEASKVDNLINNLVSKHKISDCPKAWLTYVRTIMTGLQLIEKKALIKLVENDEVITRKVD